MFQIRESYSTVDCGTKGITVKTPDLMKHALAALSTALALTALAVQSQTIKVVMHSDLKVFDPTVSTAYIVRNHGYMVFDQLVARDEKGVVKPQMSDTKIASIPNIS